MKLRNEVLKLLAKLQDFDFPVSFSALVILGVELSIELSFGVEAPSK